jgi:hypothetical protein
VHAADSAAVSLFPCMNAFSSSLALARALSHALSLARALARSRALSLPPSLPLAFSLAPWLSRSIAPPSPPPPFSLSRFFTLSLSPSLPLALSRAVSLSAICKLSLSPTSCAGAASVTDGFRSSASICPRTSMYPISRPTSTNNIKFVFSCFLGLPPGCRVRASSLLLVFFQVVFAPLPQQSTRPCVYLF